MAMQIAQAARSTAGPAWVSSTSFDSSGHAHQASDHTGCPLNAPWGMAMAPATLANFAGALLVGNFGDGTIKRVRSDQRALLGTLITADGTRSWSTACGA